MMTFAAASATRGAVHVFRTWYWTKGQFRVLGPALFALIVVPLGTVSYLVSIVVNAIAGSEPVSGGFAAVLAMLAMMILLPTAWLGHGLAASVYSRVAPALDIDEN